MSYTRQTNFTRFTNRNVPDESKEIERKAKALDKQRINTVNEYKAMVEGLKKGDKIVTSGGITGVITRVVDNDKIEVEIAENVTVEVIRGTGVQSLMNSQEVKK